MQHISYVDRVESGAESMGDAAKRLDETSEFLRPQDRMVGAVEGGVAGRGARGDHRSVAPRRSAVKRVLQLSRAPRRRARWAGGQAPSPVVAATLVELLMESPPGLSSAPSSELDGARTGK
jgi:hypothetical protein